jgi:lactate permease
MYQQIFDPVAHSLLRSSLFAVMPLLALFVLLGLLRWEARWAALTSLAVAVLVAIGVYGMPAPQALSGAAEGAAIGFFPIIWIGINAIWLYKLTEIKGHSLVLRRGFDAVSSDLRVQAVLIAFCFGSLLEALAGGGSPVAICAVMLITLRVPPVKAAAICLIADTTPVSFGALGLPISTLAKITGLSASALSAMVGRQTPLLAAFVPLILVYILDGRRGLRQTWPFAVVAGISFGAGQCLGSVTLPLELVDIVAALISTAACLVFLHLWSPSQTLFPDSLASSLPSNAPSNLPGKDSEPPVSRRELFFAALPYLTVLIVVALAQFGPLHRLLSRATCTLRWPGLYVVDPSGALVTAVTARFEWVLSAGSLVLVAGLMVAPMLGLDFKTLSITYRETLHQLRWAIVTVSAVVGVAYVMNLSGQTITLGMWAAGAGRAFAPLAPLVGWLGTAVTGSDTSTNALFGMLQVTTAHRVGLSDILLGAANNSGGVCGKAISPQNLSIAAVAVGLPGSEGDLFRQVFGWTVFMIAVMSLLVYLQSTSVLSWMVP